MRVTSVDRVIALESPLQAELQHEGTRSIGTCIYSPFAIGWHCAVRRGWVDSEPEWTTCSDSCRGVGVLPE